MLSKKNRECRRISVSARWIKFEVLLIGLVTISVMLLSDRAIAYERYKNDAGTSGSNCSACHGDFTSGVSAKGTIFPSNDKHAMHRSSAAMDTDCNLCHRNGDDENPYTDFSNGTDSNPGYGCVGCHGRDYGAPYGVTGAGLRAHHVANGISSCAGGCHFSDPTPLGEEVLPPFYGTPDTLVDDSCNSAPGYLENWSIGDVLGLDNDGDNEYDNCECVWANIDGIDPVDFRDFALLAADWGKTGPGLAGDANNDGTVDNRDLELIARFWLMNCN